jgi:hypothetical protein
LGTGFWETEEDDDGGEGDSSFSSETVARRRRPLCGLGWCRVGGGHDSVQDLEKLGHSGARDNDSIAPAVRFLADAEEASSRILAEVHREVLALHLELATGNDIFHVGFSSSGAKWDAPRQKEPRLMPQRTEAEKGIFGVLGGRRRPERALQPGCRASETPCSRCELRLPISEIEKMPFEIEEVASEIELTAPEMKLTPSETNRTVPETDLTLSEARFTVPLLAGAIAIGSFETPQQRGD